MTTTYHAAHDQDRAAMAEMRSMFAAHPPIAFAPAARPDFDALMQMTPGADGITHEAAILGGVPGWWIRPADAIDGSAILYLHGGAFVLGSAGAYRNLAGQIAARARATVFVIDYRLAPEHPFPAAVDDALAAYDALAAAGFTRIALAGDSAGGGLALSVLAARAARRTGRPVGAVVLSPWTDLALTGDSYRDRAGADPLLSRAQLDAGAGLYLGDHDRRDPGASPLYGDLADHPPVLIHVGEDEVLLDDARRYADRAGAAGSPVDLHVWQGMVHVFPSSLAILQASREALDHIGGFLGRVLSV